MQIFLACALKCDTGFVNQCYNVAVKDIFKCNVVKQEWWAITRPQVKLHLRTTVADMRMIPSSSVPSVSSVFLPQFHQLQLIYETDSFCLRQNARKYWFRATFLNTL